MCRVRHLFRSLGFLAHGIAHTLVFSIVSWAVKLLVLGAVLLKLSNKARKAYTKRIDRGVQLPADDADSELYNEKASAPLLPRHSGDFTDDDRPVIAA